MRRIGLSIFAVLCLLSAGAMFNPAQAAPADSAWTLLEAMPAARQAQEPWIRPLRYQAARLDVKALAAALETAPLEFTAAARETPLIVALPMPDGTLQRFACAESPVMAPELAARYPLIRTFAGIGLDDPSANVRFDLTPAGFHAQIMRPAGTVFIDPYSHGDDEYYVSYRRTDYRAEGKQWRCLLGDDETPDEPAKVHRHAASARQPPAPDVVTNGTTLRSYRLAVAATGEYTTFHGGTVSGALAAMVTTVNRVNQVYENEVAVRLNLIANTDDVIYTDAGTDPYTNGDPGSMIDENQVNLDAVIGTLNYDIGHVFGTDSGGLASLGSVCSEARKAKGVTGSSSPVGDPFDIDYVAHEMGHQFDANHPFNGVSGSCSGGNRNETTAYEPGSGSTIMAYAGICGPDNLQFNSDAYFHGVSLEEIVSFIGGPGASCAATQPTGNTPPTVSAGADYTIPAQTPFTLTAGSFNDPDGDTLTFCWEQYDLGPAAALSAPDDGQIPLFRSFEPTTDPSRTFPRLSDILSGTSDNAEKLPTLSRTMNFRLTVRDNRAAGGGIDMDEMQVTVSSGAGPFRVTAPNTPVTLSGGTLVSWNVANSDAAPVSAANVDILLSTDGGQTFSALLTGTPNDGSEAVTLPSINTSTARIKIQGSGNIFFDISDVNFSIEPGGPVALVLTDSAFTGTSGNFDGVLERSERGDLLVTLRNTGTQTATNVTATLASLSGTLSVLSGGPVAFPDIPSGDSVAALTPFVIELDHTHPCGAPVELELTASSDQAGATAPIQLATGFDQRVVEVAFDAITGGDTPVDIPDSGQDEIPRTVNDAGIISDVDFRIGGSSCNADPLSTTVGINHSYVSDLVITLISPSGTEVIVWNRAGEAGYNICQALFDDDGGYPSIQSVGYESEPFTGGWTPAEPLSAFDGESLGGVWRLRVADTFSEDTGTVRQFSIRFTLAECGGRNETLRWGLFE